MRLARQRQAASIFLFAILSCSFPATAFEEPSLAGGKRTLPTSYGYRSGRPESLTNLPETAVRRFGIAPFDRKIGTSPVPAWCAMSGIGGTEPTCARLGCSYWGNVIRNYMDTNRAIPGLILPTGVGLATAAITAKAVGGITFWQARRFWGLPQFGGAMIIASMNAVMNTMLVGGAFEAGILVGSMLTAIPTGPGGQTVRSPISAMIEGGSHA